MKESSGPSNGTSMLARLRRGSIWIVIGRSLGMAIVFVNMVLLAKWLPKSDFSAHVVTISVVTLSSVAAMLGLNFLACRLVSAHRAIEDYKGANRSALVIFNIGLVSSLLVASVVGLGCWWLGASWFSRPEIANMSAWIAVWIFMLAISQIIAETYRGLHNLFAAALLAGVSGGLIANALFMIGIVSCHLMDRLQYQTVVQLGSISFLVPVVISGVVLVLRWPRVKQTKPVNLNSAELEAPSFGSIISQSLPIMYLNFAALGFDKSGQLIAGAFGADLDVAVFEAIWLMAFLPLIPLTMLGLSISSTVSELFALRDMQSMEQIIKFASTISLIVSAPLLLILIVFGAPALTYTFGESFRVGALSLSIFCIVQFIRNWMGPCDIVLVMTGRQMMAFFCFACAAPILLVGPWAVANYGLVGLTLVISAAVLLSRTLQYLVILKSLGISPSAELKPDFLSRLARVIRGNMQLGLVNNK